MRAIGTRTNRINHINSARISRASHSVVEAVESRLMMSATLAAWAFDTLSASTSTATIQTSPAPTSGSGTAYTVGMQSGTANGYLYPAAGANATADASAFLAATGSADSGGNGGSEGGTNGFIWRVQSGQDSAAPIASQGVQFNVPTLGQSGISLHFDMDPSSGKAEAQFVVEYTTDVQDGANAVWTDVTQDLSFGPGNVADPSNANHVATIGTSSSDDVEIQANTSNDPNTIPTGVSGNLNGNGGYYATIHGPLVGGSNTAWLNDLKLDLSGITAVNNAPNFAVRVVNAATGTSETSVVAGAVTNGQFKNCRFNDIAVNANGSSAAAPVVITNPTDQTVAAGRPVAFTAAASGNPAPTVQWYSGAVGSGTLIDGATSTSYTFTPTGGQSGTTCYAVFTNVSGSTPTHAATLTQGVQFDVDTTGYSNITLHFDWNQGGISDMQPLYSTDGGQTWNVLPNGLITQTAPAGDYYGITPQAPPTGITVNLQGIAGVNNNPRFELRLAAAYNATLPLITDGNLILGGGNTSIPHGQYASGVAGPVNAQQVIQFGNDENSTNDVTGGTFTLTFDGATTAPIAFSSNNTTLAANITAALNALTVNGVANYLQGNFTVSATNFAGGTELNPVRDALGVVADTMTVTFKGALAATPVSAMTAGGSGLTGSNPSIVIQGARAVHAATITIKLSSLPRIRTPLIPRASDHIPHAYGYKWKRKAA